jgi:hypothetical protein
VTDLNTQWRKLNTLCVDEINRKKDRGFDAQPGANPTASSYNAGVVKNTTPPVA